MNFPLYLSIRYLRSNQKGSFTRFASLLSVIGLAVGVCALLLTLFILNGFERVISDKIAEVDEIGVRLFDGGWQSVTTKSRLNAICYEFLSPFFGVFQKNWTWFVNVQLDRTNPVPFYSGIALNV